MPRKQNELTPEEQSERFREAVREMIARGDLDPAEADRALDAMVKRAASATSPPPA